MAAARRPSQALVCADSQPGRKRRGLIRRPRLRTGPGQKTTDQRHELTATLADLDDQPQAAVDAEFQQAQGWCVNRPRTNLDQEQAHRRSASGSRPTELGLGPPSPPVFLADGRSEGPQASAWAGEQALWVAERARGQVSWVEAVSSWWALVSPAGAPTERAEAAQRSLAPEAVRRAGHAWPCS